MPNSDDEDEELPFVDVPDDLTTPVDEAALHPHRRLHQRSRLLA
jgi:hypothetical protein